MGYGSARKSGGRTDTGVLLSTAAAGLRPTARATTRISPGAELVRTMARHIPLNARRWAA